MSTQREVLPSFVGGRVFPRRAHATRIAGGACDNPVRHQRPASKLPRQPGHRRGAASGNARRLARGGGGCFDFLALMRSRFANVLWAPGNHDLWRRGDDPLCGVARYRHMVDRCREINVLTPEDPYPIWPDAEGDIVVAPLFVLYDYTLRPDGATKHDAMARAATARVVCTDETFLAPDPHPNRESWCAERLRITRARLDAIPPSSSSSATAITTPTMAMVVYCRFR
jgi:hypothetical protein